MTPRSQSILIVDDDVDFVEAVASFLEVNGYRVSRAYGGREGLRLAKTERPDLIIMDVMMTERTEGLFTVQDIRSTPELSDVRIFIVSALYSHVSEFTIPPDCKWAGFDEFIPKPVNVLELLARVREHLGGGVDAGFHRAHEDTQAG